MTNKCLYALILALSALSAPASNQDDHILPHLPLRKLQQLMTDYHNNRALFSNYGQVIGQLQNAVQDVLARSTELQASAVEALDLARAKAGVLLNNDLPQQEVDRLDERQEALVGGISDMADELTPKIDRLVSGLQSMIATRSLLFKGEDNQAYRRLAHLLNYTYHVHGQDMSAGHRGKLRRLIADFERHRADVKLGEPDNDLTSGGLYDPNNTVFSRHPENLRHNALAHYAANSHNDVRAVDDSKVDKDMDQLKDDLVKFGSELVDYIQANASKMYFTGTPEKDAKMKRLYDMTGGLEEAKRKNEEVVRRLFESEYGKA